RDRRQQPRLHCDHELGQIRDQPMPESEAIGAEKAEALIDAESLGGIAVGDDPGRIALGAEHGGIELDFIVDAVVFASFIIEEYEILDADQAGPATGDRVRKRGTIHRSGVAGPDTAAALADDPR